MIQLGTRGSLLARTQSGTVAAALSRIIGEDVELVTIRTEGDDLSVPLDAPSRPGAFVSALRDALHAGAVDLVVHSFKDLPSEPMPGLVVAAVPVREDPRDALVSRGPGLADLPPGATIGTSSPRRRAALARLRPDLRVVPLRGNVDTRLQRVATGDLDAAILAAAGLTRLGRTDRVSEYLDPDAWLPAPAQGALAVECRDGEALAEAVAVLDDPDTRLLVTAERAVLRGVEATCTTAVGAQATWVDGRLTLAADLTDHHGIDYARRTQWSDIPEADLAGAAELGLSVARALLGGHHA